MIKWHNKPLLIENIREWAKNPRIIGGKRFQDLVNSMDKFGYVDLIVVNLDGELIGGHARLQKLKADGETEVEARVPDRLLDEKEFEELAIRLNKNIAGEWDFDALVKNFDRDMLEDIGFDDLNFEDDPGKEPPEKIEPEVAFTEELFESHNYVILYFDNDLDWESAKEKLGIKTVKTQDSTSNYTRAGIGRILRGANIIDKMND